MDRFTSSAALAWPHEDTIDIETPLDALDAPHDRIAVDANAVYVADARQQSITMQPKAGGEKVTLAVQTGPVAAVVPKANDVVYVTEQEGRGGAVYGVPKTGGDPLDAARILGSDPTSFAFPMATSGIVDPVGVAADDHEIFYSTRAHDAIYAAPRAGGAPRVVVAFDRDDGDARDLAVDDTSVYWTGYASGDVMRAPKHGGAAPVPVALGRARPTGIVAGGDSLYWVDDVGPTEAILVRADKNGGAAVALATGRTMPSNLVLDGDRLVWAEGGVAHWLFAKDTPPPGESLVVHTYAEAPAFD